MCDFIRKWSYGCLNTQAQIINDNFRKLKGRLEQELSLDQITLNGSTLVNELRTFS